MMLNSGVDTGDKLFNKFENELPCDIEWVKTLLS